MQFNISQLSDGVYNHQIEEKTFQFEENESVENLNVHLKFDKAFDSLHVHLDLEFDKDLQCDRCLESNRKHLNNSYDFVYSRNPSLPDSDEPEGDVRFLPHDQNIIDVTGDVIQTILLGIPMKNVCSAECKGLCPVCGTNKNKSDCSCSDQKIDPRMESLLKFKV